MWARPSESGNVLLGRFAVADFLCSVMVEFHKAPYFIFFSLFKKSCEAVAESVTGVKYKCGGLVGGNRETL